MTPAAAEIARFYGLFVSIACEKSNRRWHLAGNPAPAFFHEKESLAKKADCRAAPLSRLDRRF